MSFHQIRPGSIAVVAAREPTQCDHCGEPIDAGEAHVRRDFTLDGRPCVGRRHGECEEAMGALPRDTMMVYVPGHMRRGGTVPKPD
jgi:hypothetical protein